MRWKEIGTTTISKNGSEKWKRQRATGPKKTNCKKKLVREMNEK